MTATISDFYNRTTKTFTVTITYTGVNDFTGDSLRLIMKYSDTSPDINKTVSLTSGGVGTYTLDTSDTDIDARAYLTYIQWERADGSKFTVPLDSNIVTVKENPVPTT